MDVKAMNARTDGANRPRFPSRAVVTAGMPYGNKELHFGHVGGMYVHADVYARFLRDRIGAKNVIFVSGTDCYGSPIVEDYRRLSAAHSFDGTIEEFVRRNYESQKRDLAGYDISLNLFAGSAIGRARAIHEEVGAEILRSLFAHGHLRKLSAPQFYDTEQGIFLNGRQVVGRCPIEGCASDRGYADECSLGHQYEPGELVDPRSTISGRRPEMREVINWYLDLPKFAEDLAAWVDTVESQPSARAFVVSSIREFLEPPSVYVTNAQSAALAEIVDRLPAHRTEESQRKSVRLVFESLHARDTACATLAGSGIHYRKGKTLVPFRLTGNVEWGLPAPTVDGLSGRTFWVWPESLWAPISFTQTYLESIGEPRGRYSDFWSAADADVYQFIGADNVYFYGPAEMGIFLGMQAGRPSANGGDGEMKLPQLVVNNHILYFDSKASSSSDRRPPLARELLSYYTSDQLRTHFLSLSLHKRSVGFKPKPLDPTAREQDADPVLKEANLLSNVFNRAVRTCFYTLQSELDGEFPAGSVSPDVVSNGISALLDFEASMARQELSQALAVADAYVRTMNKRWEATVRTVRETGDESLRKQNLIDGFHMVRVASLMFHPIAPKGTERVRDYLNVGPEFFAWDRAFDPLPAFFPDGDRHQFKTLEPRVDFFEKHPSQVG